MRKNKLSVYSLLIASLLLSSLVLVCCNTSENLNEPTKLSVPVVTVSDDGIANWTCANASEFIYRINGGLEIGTKQKSVKLQDGDSIEVKAVGDGNSYTDSDWSSAIKYVAPQTTIYRSDYTPTLFGGSTASYEITEITEGFKIVKNTITLTGGNTVVIYSLEVNLNNVNIVAGTSNNVTELSKIGTATPYAQGQAYTEATGKKVLASLNADFFGGSTPVNAFVKDGVIVKAKHNDNGVYDYLDTSSDLPASAPMLLGVKGTTAQIAPIISYTGNITDATVKEQVVTASLSYGLSVDGSAIYSANSDTTPTATSLAINTSSSAKRCPSGGCAVRLDLSEGIQNMKVKEVVICDSSQNFRPDSGEAYVLVHKNHAAFDLFAQLKAGDTVSQQVISPDGTWNGYTTILGCRQSLVQNGSVAETVELENTNGAQKTDVPRSAVGIKADGTVVIFAVESMYYYGKNVEGDTHGLNLPELAQFMCFYGIQNGANFDGGGSTQLIVTQNGKSEVLVRSADTASYELTDARAVINTILVVEK